MLLHYQLAKIYLSLNKPNQSKAYLAPVAKSDNQLLNQCSNKSENCLQEAPYKPA